MMTFRGCSNGVRRFGAHGAPCLIMIVLAATLLAGVAQRACAQTAKQANTLEYEKRKRKALFDASQRHLNLGAWLRKQGLIPQATNELLRAVEVGEGVNQGADTVLSAMRGYGDAFWRIEQRRPSKDMLASYANQHEAIEKQTRLARTLLALYASSSDLGDEARAQCLAVLKLGGAELEIGSGQKSTRLEGHPLPAALGKWLAKQTIPVNANAANPSASCPRVFDAAASRLPQLKEVAEHASPAVIVRTDLGSDAARRLHAMVTGLLPHLEERLDGRPTRALVLFVFKTRADYGAYLVANGTPELAAASGVAEYGSFQTLACADGLPEDDLNALVLHELSHLFFFGVAPAHMPDWYAEGFAESFGGQGTFKWDGSKLTIGGLLRKDRLDALKKDPMPMHDFLAGDVLALLARERASGLKFYAQAWAFMRFLREGKHAWRDRFQQWEAQCRGTLIGANPGAVSKSNPAPAKQLFEKEFAKDLDKIETAFRAWLAAL